MTKISPEARKKKLLKFSLQRQNRTDKNLFNKTVVELSKNPYK